MKRSGFSLWELIGVLALMLIGAAILLPMFARGRGGGHRVTCPNHLKQISIGYMQYSQDWDEQLPLIALSPTSTALDSKIPYQKQRFYGWADALYPYTKSVQLFQCPSETTPEGAKPTTSGYTDYWFNSNLSGFAMADVKVPKQTLIFGDGNDGSDLTDARYNLPSLPAAWINDQNSPAYRHIGGANYAFVDGHVKRMTPAEIAAGPATFAPQP